MSSILEIVPHLSISLFRVVTGVSLGASIATILAIFVPIETQAGIFLNRIVYSIQPIPKIIFLPFLISYLGLGEFSKIAMIAVYGFFQNFIIIRDSIQHIDKELILLMETMKAKNKDIIYHVIWPNSLPYLFTGLRTTMGTAFAVLFIVESFASYTGIGYFLINAWTRNANIQFLLCVITFALAGLGLTKILKLIEYRVVQWKEPIQFV